MKKFFLFLVLFLISVRLYNYYTDDTSPEQKEAITNINNINNTLAKVTKTLTKRHQLKYIGNIMGPNKEGFLRLLGLSLQSNRVLSKEEGRKNNCRFYSRNA